MALKASYEFLFFGKDDNSFLENYYYDLFQDYGEKSGQIFINLEVQNNPVDAEEMGKVMFEAMQKTFFEDVNRDPYERFEVSLKEVNRVLTEFKKQKFSGYIGNLNVIIAAIVGNVLYLTQSGDAEAYLIRKRYVSVVSEGLADEESSSGEVFSSIASGNIEPGDFVLVSSTRLLRYLSKNDLAKGVKKTVVQSLESFKDMVSTEILGRIGLTGIYFETATQDEIAGIEQGVDSATESLLEATGAEVVSKRESLTGKFFTAFKKYKRGRKSEVFQGSGAGFFSRAGEFFVRFWQGLFQKGFGKDKILALLVVFIIVLGVGIWFVRGNSQAKAEITRLDKILQTVQEGVSDAQTRSSYDKEGAKTLLDKSYADAMTVYNSGYLRDKARLYLIQIETARDTLDNVQRIETPKLVVDLASKRSNVNALGFVNVNKRLFVFEYNALYEIVLDQLQDPLTIDDKETVIAATGFEERGSIVFMTKSGKFIEYKNGTMSYMDTDDGSFRKGVALKDWANKIYVLDPENNQIWKYPYKGIQEKFGAAEGYLIADEKTDISKAKDFAIDGNLYALLSTGELYKFYSGKKADFYLNGAPQKIMRDPSVVYTNDKLDYVYILDSKEGRVLIYKKDTKTGNLNYNSQYLVDGVGEIRDLHVDPESKTLYLLTATKVYQISL